jgi:hypothetical protein
MTAFNLTNFKSTIFWTCILLLCAAARLVYWEYDYVVVDTAETIYHVKELSIGRIPYRDIFSHHFLGYLAPFYLIEQFISISPEVMHVLAILTHLLNCWLAYRCIAVINPQWISARYLGAFICATLGWLRLWHGDTFNNPSYFLPLLFLYLMTLFQILNNPKKYSSVSSGACLGIMTLFDQRLVLLCLVSLTLVFLLESHKRIQFIQIHLFGFCVPIFPALAYLLYHGAVNEWFRQTVLYPLFLRSKGELNLLSVYQDLFIGGVSAEPCLPILSVVAMFGLLYRYDLCARGVLFISALVACFAYVIAGRRFSPHYLLVFTPVLILLAALVPELIGKRFRITCRSIIFLFSLSYAAYPLIKLGKAGLYLYPRPATVSRQVATYVDQISPRDANILVWGYAPQIYLLSKRFSNFQEMGLISVAGTNFNSTSHELQGIDSVMEQRFKSYLEIDPPDVLVHYHIHWQKNMDFLTIEHLSYLKDLVLRDYYLSTSFEDREDSASIYVRRGQVLPASHKLSL